MLNDRNNQSGAVLVVTLTFLVMITLISLAAMGSSHIELKMAGNHEERIAAAQVSQAAIDAVSNNDDNFVVTGVNGTTKTNATFTGVSEFTNTAVVITELGNQEPPRGSGLSADKFTTGLFSVDSAYNGLSSGRGQSRIVQGVMILVSKSSQSTQ